LIGHVGKLLPSGERTVLGVGHILPSGGGNIDRFARHEPSWLNSQLASLTSLPQAVKLDTVRLKSGIHTFKEQNLSWLEQ
jgi:hypothetical protein